MQVAELLVPSLVEHAGLDQTVEDEPELLLEVGTLVLAAGCDLVLEEILPLLENYLRRLLPTRSVPPEPHSSVLL